MSSSRPPFGDHDIGVPRMSPALLDKLATQLRDCCHDRTDVDRIAVDRIDLKRIDVTDRSERALAVERSQPRRRTVVRTVPTTAELDGALSTIARAAALMAEFQSLMKPVKEYEDVKRGLHVLSERLSQYEYGFEALTGQLRDTRDIAEVYRRRCVTAERKLDALKEAVADLFGMLPANGLTTLEHEAATY